MRILGLIILAMLFVATPLMLFDAVVMPQLTELKTVYGNADAIARSAAGE